jgi:predicted phosphodiesterase
VEGVCLKLAVISDIHGNLEAFREVLRDIDSCRVGLVLCLGDCVGYGPEPEAVIRLIREREIPCTMGNHELGIVDPEFLNWFNPVARKSLLLTRGLISSDTLVYLRKLNASMTAHGCLCVHGAPPASMTTYLYELNQSQLLHVFTAVEEKVCFVGHTHQLNLIQVGSDGMIEAPLFQGLMPLAEDMRYIVNVGSVGQPRDGSNHAKYVIWDTATDTLEVRFVPYDIAATAEKILQLGLPSVNARRLW